MLIRNAVNFQTFCSIYVYISTYNIFIFRIFAVREVEVTFVIYDMWVGPLPKYQRLLTLLLADDRVMISNTEDNMQKSVCKLSQ
jgi:hypothetical protein